MIFNQDTRHKIEQFAKEQSQHYLDAVEMTYLEKLRRKTGQTKRKLSRNLARFKGRSDQAIEAQNDMILYMSDYMNDLMSKGLSEQEAFDKAKKELAASSESDAGADLQERFRQYYENLDPADYEAMGLFYGGFLFLGLAVGGGTGFLTGGGRTEFLNGGWIDTLIGVGIGAFIGIALGLISHAILTMIRRKQV